MTGWLILVALALVAGAILWRFGGFRGPALQFLAAAMLLAMAGYAWQGRPGLGGSPAATVEPEAPESPFAALRDEFLPQFDAASRWLIIADGYQRRGDTQGGVQVIRSGLRASPQNMSLWMGLGNALVIHGGYTMNEAADLAYRRAITLAPQHPAPRFFYGMSLIEAGRVADGERMWSNLLASAPADASWRPFVAERLGLLRQLMAMQQQRAPRPTQ